MRLLLAALIWFWLAGGAWAQPVKTNAGNANAAFSGAVNLSVTAGSGDLVEVFAYGAGASAISFSTCGAINSGDWVTRYAAAADATNFMKLVAAKAPSALSGCTLTITGTGASAISGMYGAWSGTSTGIWDSNFPSAALQNSGAVSKPTGVPTVTAQAKDMIITWEVNAGDTAVDCQIATGGTGSWSSVANGNNINVGGYTAANLSTTVTQSFTPTNAGGSCNTKALWQVLIDAITADTPVTGRSRLIQ